MKGEKVKTKLLYLLLMSMLDDLRAAIGDVDALMPEDAERVRVPQKQLKEEYRNDPFRFGMIPEAWEVVEEVGDFVALTPLFGVADKWEARIKMLLDGDA